MNFNIGRGWNDRQSGSDPGRLKFGDQQRGVPEGDPSNFKLRSLNFHFTDLNSRVLSPYPDSAGRLRRLGLRVDQFEEIFSRSSGPGGQNVNKVSTAVTLVHRPSGTSVTVQETRSQYRNRQLAFDRLITLIEETLKHQAGQRRAAAEQERRRNSKRPRALRREIRKSKEHRAGIKLSRAKISPE